MTELEKLFGLSPSLAFHENDLDPDVYEKLVTEVDQKSRQYYNNPKSRRGRELETIRFNTWCGMVAEKYLIHSQGFKQDYEKYRDLIKTFRAEIKTAVSKISKNDILDRLHKRATKYEHVIFFNRKGKQYRIESYYQYDFDKKKYVQIENYGVY